MFNIPFECLLDFGREAEVIELLVAVLGLLLEVLGVVDELLFIALEHLLLVGFCIMEPQPPSAFPINRVVDVELAIHYAASSFHLPQLQASHAGWKLYWQAMSQIICQQGVDHADDAVEVMLTDWMAYVVPMVLADQFIAVVDTKGISHFTQTALSRPAMLLPKLYHLLLHHNSLIL